MIANKTINKKENLVIVPKISTDIKVPETMQSGGKV